MFKKSMRALLAAFMATAALAVAGTAFSGHAVGPQPVSAAEITSASGKSSGLLAELPAYTSAAYTEVNGNVPYFSASELTTEAFEHYSSLDALGRCGVAYANICKELMPTEERGSIGAVKPSGWQIVKYEGIDGNYLYNRCHLIGYQLAGENANEKNLITGTRYLNVTGMLPFENEVAQYVKATGNHVLYRATPVFQGSELVARGVLLEAESVEDQGSGVQFNVFCYNVQPGITIDYTDGSSCRAETVTTAVSSGQEGSGSAAGSSEQRTGAVAGVYRTETAASYIGNANSKIFHRSSCESVRRMAEKNKVTLSSRDEAVRQGYTACKKCNP